MTETVPSSETNGIIPSFQFGEEIELEEAGFSFRPITDYELEIDGSVYMYSEDGNLEISLVGGTLDEKTSIAELNDELAAEFMENFDTYDLFEAGTETLGNLTGFLNEIHFNYAEEEGRGQALICSPYPNQFFFILVIASLEHWQQQGQAIFNAVKSQIRFYPRFKPDDVKVEKNEHPDLTIEVFPEVNPDENLILQIEKGDVSLLLAARSMDVEDDVLLTALQGPGNRQLYHYDPDTTLLESEISDEPVVGNHGEVCFFFPRDNRLALLPGQYRFTFDTRSGAALEEVQVILRAGRALDLQALDLNLWIAAEDEVFNDARTIECFSDELKQALDQRLSPLSLKVGKIETFLAAPDELEAFSHLDLETDLADCSYMIAETITNARALNIGLVQHLTQGGTPREAASAGRPGMILSSSSPHACILLAWTAFQGDLQRMANALIEQFINFSGIETEDNAQQDGQQSQLNREIAWRLRRHPVFYDAE